MDEAGISATVQQGQLRAWPSAARRQSVARALAAFPGARFGHFPTSFKPIDRLTEHLGGLRTRVKSDACTGLSSGGDKTRTPEILMADALGQGADTIIIQGATHTARARASQLKRLCGGTVSGPVAMTRGRAMTVPPKA